MRGTAEKTLPAEMAAVAREALKRIHEAAGESLAEELESSLAQKQVGPQLERLLACSPYAARQLAREPAMLAWLLEEDRLERRPGTEILRQELCAMLEAGDTGLARTLRRFRQRQQVRILWRDFNRLSDTVGTMTDVSELAEVCIAEALERCHAIEAEKSGEPTGSDSGAPQRMLVLAMGKLGAGELNVSSDIDLIFTYPESGETEGGARRISNQEFFTKVGQALINTLDQVLAEGFVFRVDMRLRPYGESGPLVQNFASLEAYYQEQGREWERYALVKARPITGDPAMADELMDMLRPFVYRRYIDFSVIDSLREMKRLIAAEIRRRGLQDDVKLGPGGIREVEFIVQCIQLIRGGREPGLRRRELLAALHECAALESLPADAEEELRAAYLFLRDSEHAIQGYEDKQSQALPHSDEQRLVMATVMGFESWEAYRALLEHHRSVVTRHFNALIAAPDEEEESETGEDHLLWGDGLEEAALDRLGFSEPASAEGQLRELAESPRIATLQAEGRRRLDAFMPQLLRACGACPQPDLALARLLPLVTAVSRRSAYLVLLLENPQALTELVGLCAASPWISDLMTRHPVLLDELLDRASLYTAPDKKLLQEELQQLVLRLPRDDLEAHMEALRYFKVSHDLRVAASELAGRLPLMQVSDKLTWIAEVILEQVVELAWNDLSARHGLPAGMEEAPGFAIFGYGKLGGIELGYGSDLDLVFLYDAAPGGATDGERSLDNAVFYTRLGQRIIHLLEARMSMGQLYEVDMRLRPSGASGMLVTTVKAFDQYQRESAWTWEHQALVRARYVAGSARVARQVDEVRRDVLGLRRDTAALALEVCRMRDKMRGHLLPASPEGFHLKQGAGGIVDIEFIVQYLVLAYAHTCPALVEYSDNIRILEAAAQHGVMKEEDSRVLIEAYLALRSAAHQLALQKAPDLVAEDGFEEHRAAVRACWRALLGDSREEMS